MSDYTAVRAVVRGWNIFIEDLQNIQVEDDFKKDWDLAKGIENLLRSRSFVLGLHFMFDLLETLKKFSVMTQKSAGILVGKEGKRLNLLKALEDLGEKNGPELTMLLKNSECSDKQNNYCTCKDFLDSSLTGLQSTKLLN